VAEHFDTEPLEVDDDAPQVVETTAYPTLPEEPGFSRSPLVPFVSVPDREVPV
jgi:hypothetical protein